MFAALLDTSVLWPSLQRDVLLSFDAEGLYRPVWSSAILEELEYHEAQKLCRRGVDEADARRRASGLISAMRAAFDDAEVTGSQALEGSFALPDSEDEHVVAAAVVGGAGVIVTHNTRDFPPDRIPSMIEVQTPAVFAHHTVS